ncbi:uncharacterized protein TM35_000262170 [Trypanosoma theileri]|uniref:Uncharacterized protein n=1 Tax=Trypanosoma theileri TaxID=67003 RepID=A0A1X0NPX9_9TRYP|nr:uncharacterized protein TM35_000262170 [Trypanosoma theileri]ORC86765.1 hypothetical protein TM35_000262170 [Trypanosoma theileri]
MEVDSSQLPSSATEHTSNNTLSPASVAILATICSFVILLLLMGLFFITRGPRRFISDAFSLLADSPENNNNNNNNTSSNNNNNNTSSNNNNRRRRINNNTNNNNNNGNNNNLNIPSPNNNNTNNNNAEVIAGQPLENYVRTPRRPRATRTFFLPDGTIIRLVGDVRRLPVAGPPPTQSEPGEGEERVASPMVYGRAVYTQPAPGEVRGASFYNPPTPQLDRSGRRASQWEEGEEKRCEPFAVEVKKK